MEQINLSKEFASTIQDMESVLAGKSRMYEVYEVRYKVDGKAYKYHYQSIFVEAEADIDSTIKERVDTVISTHGVDADQLFVSRVEEDEVNERLDNLRFWSGQDN